MDVLTTLLNQVVLILLVGGSGKSVVITWTIGFAWLIIYHTEHTERKNWTVKFQNESVT